jgi:hypothetical protein
VITPLLMDDRIWKDIRNSMVPIVNEKYGVYVQKRNGDWSFSQEQFGAYLEREGLLEIWPRTATGKLSTDDETLEDG